MNPRRHVRGWLLWLALLLPLAQAFAAVHALSHVSGERQDDRFVHRVHCDLCVTAAQLGAGAPAAAPGPLPSTDAVQARAAVPQQAPAGRATTRRPPVRGPPASA